MFILFFNFSGKTLQSYKIYNYFSKNSQLSYAKGRIMKEGKEIAGFALPFAAGTLAVSFFDEQSFIHISIMSSSILAAGMVMLLQPFFRLKRWQLGIIIPIVASCCGMLCFIAGEKAGMTAGCNPSGPRYAERFGLWMQMTVDAMEFKDPQSNALLKALICGERSDLSDSTLQTFRRSGASHILALSGLHLGIIYTMITFCLSTMGNHPGIKIFRSCLIVAICGFYTLSAGASDSIVRAFIFVLLIEIASITGRSRRLTDIFMAALIIQLSFFPDSISNVGFQLSYAAMAGIVFIFPLLKTFYPDDESRPGWFSNPLKKIWETCALSISCQLTTGPLAWMYFGTFPKYFMLTNLLALPLTGIAIPLALITLILSGSGHCPTLLTKTTELVLTALVKVLESISIL